MHKNCFKAIVSRLDDGRRARTSVSGNNANQLVENPRSTQ